MAIFLRLGFKPCPRGGAGEGAGCGPGGPPHSAADFRLVVILETRVNDVAGAGAEENGKGFRGKEMFPGGEGGIDEGALGDCFWGTGWTREALLL